jgi:hypothetical protein
VVGDHRDGTAHQVKTIVRDALTAAGIGYVVLVLVLLFLGPR